MNSGCLYENEYRANKAFLMIDVDGITPPSQENLGYGAWPFSISSIVLSTIKGKEGFRGISSGLHPCATTGSARTYVLPR